MKQVLVTLIILLGSFQISGCGSDSRVGGQNASEEASPKKQLYTCGMHPQVIRDGPGLCPICGMKLVPLQSDLTSDSNIRIDPVMVQNMGVRVARVTQGILSDTVKAYGSLAEAEPKIHDVSLRVSGYIEKLYADTVGQYIEKGSPLFELYSPDLSVALAEFASTNSASNQDPIKSPAGRKLLNFGLEPSQILTLSKSKEAQRVISILSPISGHLVEKNVVQGGYMEMGGRVLRIVDHSELWFDARVYEQDLSKLEVGKETKLQFEAYPGEIFVGTITFIHPHIDPTSRAGLVRVSVANKEFRLKPGMFGEIKIRVDSVKEWPLVPREALIDSGERKIIFVHKGEGRFEPREVKVAMISRDGIAAISSGVKVGEEIVLSGQFLLDSESRLREALQKFGSDSTISHQEGAAETPPNQHIGHAH